MFIGKNIIVKDAKNKSIQGVSGLVVDETKNTITIKQQNNQQDIKNKNQTRTKQITIIKEQTITIEETP